ncbi:MAG: HD domain-containing protein [Desulfurococcaceae archaeon]
MEAIINELKNFIHEIQSEDIRDLVEGLINEPLLTFTDAKPVIKLEDSPAAPRKHHFFTGGLILHTYSVVNISLSLAEILNEVYGLKVNRDIVIAVAILHDIFKYYQYEPDYVNGGYKIREDWFLGHDYAVVAELSRRNAPEKLIRAISEVHGQAPFTTTEGLIVHLADSIDARIVEILQNTLLSRAKEYERDCPVHKALNKLIAEIGLQRVMIYLFNETSNLKQTIKEVCNNITQVEKRSAASS